MKRLFTQAVVILCAVLSFTAARAGALDEILERGALRVGLEPAYMPFELTNQRGEIIGFDVDMARLMAKAMDVELELVSTAWDGIIPALLTGKFDIIMSGMTLTQQRNMRVNFADPYIVVGQTILLRKALADRVKSYRDLNDPEFKVVSKLGTTGEIAARKYMPRATYISFETEQEGVMEVVNGRADAFVYDSPYNVVAAAQRGEGKVVFLDEPFTYEPLAWAVRQGDHDFINWLNHFLNQVKKDGSYDRIYEKWFKDDTWLKELQ